ncbi:MAG: hypothetical protein CVV42_14630 [Candidatus Riflebacteria bacterium HGW-Riflebacteria-2]|nr:MAG: hypothetical protein CVV42_14630 [Candidatus Riflebacteria bacterium HGW-Riflebacteria-2]
MRKNTLRVLSSVMCLILLATLVFQEPLMAATQTIPVRVGGEVLNVTPGQWVSVRSGTQITHYNVRFVNGRPVALEMSQYTKLVFGEGVVGNVSGNTGAGSQPSNSGSSSSSTPSGSQTSKPSTGSQPSQGAGTPVGGSIADDVAQSTNQTSGGKTPTQTTGNTSGQTSGQTSQTTGQTSQTSGQTTGGNYEQLELPFGKPTTQSQSQTGNSQGSGNYEQLELPFDQPQTAQGPNGAGSVADDLVQTGGTNAAGSVADDLVQTGGTTTTESTTTTSTKTSWDPSRHPRDPQTGRFISHDEAIKRGLMDPPDGYTGGSVADDVAQNGGSVADDMAQTGQTDQTGQTGSVADDMAQTDQTGQTGSVADDMAQAGTAGTVADDAAQANGKPTVGDKFRAGYETGKGMTNQGFQNVKDSLKSGFSAKNLLITAGITVGVDLATQIMRGEKPSVKKALKTVCSAEFAGGVVGAVTGAAAGSFFVPFLSAIPVVGGALSALAPAFGSIVGSSMGAYLAGDLKNGRFSIKEAFKRIDWVGVTGQAIGSTVGAALGSALGPIGTIAGGMIGGYLGNWAAQKIAGMFGRGQANLPELAMPTGGGASVGGFSGPVSTGGDATVGEDQAVPVSGEDVVVIGGNSGAVVGGYESEVALAYSKYQELYKLYNEMLRQNRQADALAVADAMNKAKKEYDDLRTQAGK